MKNILLFGVILSVVLSVVLSTALQASAAIRTKKVIRVSNLVVEAQKPFKFEGSKGLLVKFKGVKKEIFLPMIRQNKKQSVLDALNLSQSQQSPLKIKLVRAGRDLIQYRGKAGSEILALGADCRKTKTTENPRLFCNKGYFIESIETTEVFDATIVE